MKYLFLVVFLAFNLNLFGAVDSGGIITSADELKERIKQASPGDTLRMASGEWKDLRLSFTGKGKAEAPIVLMGAAHGGTVLCGNSSLEIAGEYLVVKGLQFRDGYAKGRVAVKFKKGDQVAKYCRLTEVVIDHYNPDDRFEKTSWIELYGQKNEIDHCYFGGKLNAGVLMAVKLNNVESRENYHHIHHNYFGERPKLGSNGGETLRVGVSTYCEKSSNTIIEQNYFEHCSGEVEIVSIKSSDNVVKNNVFLGCEGVLALRHGDRNQVIGNYFLGEGKGNAGGVRVINGGHTIKDNYFQDLGGKRFFGALPIMNGVPNSLANRYIRAHDVTVENNKFFNCSHIELCVGSDRERTQTPDHITIKNNLFVNPEKAEILTVLDDISGFTFKGNEYINNGSTYKQHGFKPAKAQYTLGEKGLYTSKTFKPELPVVKGQAGPDWYTPLSKKAQISNQVLKADNFKSLNSAIEQAEVGATIAITSAEISFEEVIRITKPLRIISENGQEVKMFFKENPKQASFFAIENGGSLLLDGFAFNGRSEVGISKAALRTSKDPMIQHYRLEVKNCTFKNFDAADYCVFRAFEGTFADELIFENSHFENISGIALNINGQTDNMGRYSAEEVLVKGCTFKKVMTGAMEITRRGNDESTTGPLVLVQDCDFVDVGNKELGSVIMLWGVQHLTVDNLFFYNSGRSGRIIRFEDPLWAVSTIDNILSISSGRIESYYPRRGENIKEITEDTSLEKAYELKQAEKKGAVASKNI
ncbi:polysaccharide lyase 6 family protein [Persicobacter diffluens]|uniref:Poly(Beta-D-mannuronate) lyase n=1 Tax=Persicobacter diffluens TaxID=981 RepID=A0AAN4W2W2_9BACT|nr:hypothetical protein PEDI_46690 [Persicobacter diffluens]